MGETGEHVLVVCGQTVDVCYVAVHELLVELSVYDVEVFFDGGGSGVRAAEAG
jgi:hypothetical protein